MAIVNGLRSFIADLSLTDLKKLRHIVKRVHMRHLKSHQITDYEADKYIESLGPQTRETLVKVAVDKHGLR